MCAALISLIFVCCQILPQGAVKINTYGLAAGLMEDKMNMIDKR